MVAVFAPLRRPREDQNRTRPPLGLARRDPSACRSRSSNRHAAQGPCQCPRTDRRSRADGSRFHPLSRGSRSVPGRRRRSWSEAEAYGRRESGKAGSNRDGRVAGRGRALRSLGLEDSRSAYSANRRLRPAPRLFPWRELSPDPPTIKLLSRGQATSPGPVVPPGFPAVLVPSQPEFLPLDERTDHPPAAWTLARWPARPEHPLTARVIVNRVWQFHFGEGLVRTPSDFGTAGRPAHPYRIA